MGGEKGEMVLSLQWRMIAVNIKKKTIFWRQNFWTKYPESQNSKIVNSDKQMLFSFWFCKSLK